MINVTGAGYADCDGLYSISNMSSIWDNKRIVYERVAGGWRPMDKRLNLLENMKYLSGMLIISDTCTGMPTFLERVFTDGVSETSSLSQKVDPFIPRVESELQTSHGKEQSCNEDSLKIL